MKIPEKIRGRKYVDNYNCYGRHVGGILYSFRKGTGTMLGKPVANLMDYGIIRENTADVTSCWHCGQGDNL